PARADVEAEVGGVELAAEVTGIDVRADEGDAAAAGGPDLRTQLATERKPADDVAQERGHVAVADVEVVRGVLEAVGPGPEVGPPADDASAHPSEGGAEVDALLELVAEVVDVHEVGVTAEVRADERREVPIGRGPCRRGRHPERHDHRGEQQLPDM